MRSCKALLVAAALLSYGASSLAQEAALGSNVESLLAYAQQHNAEFAAMRHEAQAAQERVVPAGALPDPRFRATLQDITQMGTQNPSLLPGRVGKAGYLFMQDLPWFGKRELRSEIARQDAQGAQGRTLGSWAELASRIQGAYVQLFFVQRSEQLLSENLGLMAQLEQVALTRYAGGLAAQQDVIRAQVEQGGMAAEQIALQMEHHHLHARVNALLGREPDAALAPPAALRTLPAADKLDWSLLRERVQAKNPQLFTEDARLHSAQTNRDLVRRNRYPDFTFGVSPMQSGTAIKEWEVMVELNIPLQQGSRAAQEREADAMLAAAQERKRAAADQVYSDLTQGLSALEAARRTSELLDSRLLPQAELTFRSALAAYENGKVDFATLLDAQKQIRQARLAQLKAQQDAHLQLAEIERILGETL